MNNGHGPSKQAPGTAWPTHFPLCPRPQLLILFVLLLIVRCTSLGISVLNWRYLEPGNSPSALFKVCNPRLKQVSFVSVTNQSSSGDYRRFKNISAVLTIEHSWTVPNLGQTVADCSSFKLVDNFRLANPTLEKIRLVPTGPRCTCNRNPASPGATTQNGGRHIMTTF